jgi:hypothetical protein
MTTSGADLDGPAPVVVSCEHMRDTLSPRTLSVRQIITLDRLEAYDVAACVVGWIFSGPLVRLNSGVHVYIPPDGHPIRVPLSILFPNNS